jgi:hypothetical protein
MRYTVQYIPLTKIKPNFSMKVTKNIKKLRHVMRDCIQLLIVKKNKRGGYYTLLSGNEHYDYYQKHTTKKFVPCLIDESKNKKWINDVVFRFRNRYLLRIFPKTTLKRITPAGLSIIRSFLKQEPRFKKLSRNDQIKVIMLAVKYKKQMVLSMKLKVDEFSRK